MDKIGRYVKFHAKPEIGDELAARLQEAAESLEGVRGCELYVVSRSREDPDTVWVSEVWSTQADLDNSLNRGAVRAQVAAVQSLLDSKPEVIDTTPLGGVGLRDTPTGTPPYTHISLKEVQDVAATHGFGETGESRFANQPLATHDTGLSIHRLYLGKRQAFGHRHQRAEEVYVVISGSGRVKLEDDLVELAALDAIRVSPTVARAFEAGPHGMELLAAGPRTPGDGEVLHGWWT